MRGTWEAMVPGLAWGMAGTWEAMVRVPAGINRYVKNGVDNGSTPFFLFNSIAEQNNIGHTDVYEIIKNIAETTP